MKLASWTKFSARAYLALLRARPVPVRALLRALPVPAGGSLNARERVDDEVDCFA